jgi:hypothetical protein
VTAEVESRWRDRLGTARFDALRAALAAVAEHLDPLLPDCLPILGYGLFTRRDRGGKDAARPAAATLPVDAPATGDLPLWALLSRPLRAFAEQYEAEPGPSLAISANLLRVLTETGVRTKDIPALAADVERDWRTPLRRRHDNGAAAGPRAARGGRPAAAPGRPRAVPGRLACPGSGAGHAPALPDDPAPRRLPRRQLTLRLYRCGGDLSLGKAPVRRC